jgi:hypothetical protein
MAKRKQKRFSAQKEVRAIARERVGTVKPGQIIIPKRSRRPKYRSEDPVDPDAESQTL